MLWIALLISFARLDRSVIVMPTVLYNIHYHFTTTLVAELVKKFFQAMAEFQRVLLRNVTKNKNKHLTFLAG